MKLEEKESKRSEAGSKVEQKPDPIVELLESPTWKHRKEDVQFSPFKANCEVKKNSKRCMDRITLFDCSKPGAVGSQSGGNSLRKSTEAARKSHEPSPAGSNRASVRLSIQKPVPEYQDEEDAEQSLDDFAQYVKHTGRSPAKGSPRKAAGRGQDSISSPIRAHLYRSALR